MKARKKLLVMSSVLLLAACSSPPPSPTGCPPTPINLEWYEVEGDGGVYLPERSFKNLQLYILDLKQCAIAPLVLKPPSEPDGMRALIKHSVAKANAVLALNSNHHAPALIPP
ncbi:hypothetical protein AB6C44_23745 [Vibrio splendidus]